MSAKPRFNGVMLVSRLDNLGMLRGRPVLKRTIQALPSKIRAAYEDRRSVSKHWLPMSWLVQLHQAIDEVTGAGTTLSRQLGYFGTQRAFGGIGKKLAGFSSPKNLFRIASKIYHTYYAHGSMTVVRAEAQLVVARWEGCAEFDAHNWQVTFGSCQAMLELARARTPHIELVSGGGDDDDSAEIAALWS